RRVIAGMFRGADLVIVLGRRDRSLVEHQLGVPAARIAVLPNSVPDPWLHLVPERRTARDRPVTILFLGTLGERKGVPDLLAALARPELRRSNWHAVLAGDGPVEAYR